ncbi:MAG: hypothetical protein OHK0032_15200 [Thermodesulfovibrionales bacterium]
MRSFSLIGEIVQMGGRERLLTAFFFLLIALMAGPIQAEETVQKPSIKDMAAVVADGTRSDRERLNAARLLAESQDRDSLTPIFKVIGDNREKGILRAAMVRALDKSSQRHAVVPFLNGLLSKKEDIPEVRAAVAFTLGSLGDPSSKPLLLKNISDPHPDVRQAARSALLSIGGEGIDRVGLLIDTLKDRSQSRAIMAMAALQLGQLKDERSLWPLIEVLKEKVNEPNLGAPKDFKGFIEARRHAKENVQATAARALGQLGKNESIPVLLKFTCASDAELRIAVFEALATLKANEAVPAARKAIGSDSNHRVRRWAGVLLREVDSREALPELRKALSDPDPGVRLQAALSIGKMKDKEALKNLEDALSKETYKDVREAIENAIRIISGLRGRQAQNDA